MGVCIRTGINLVLDFPSIFWKQLISSNPNLDDIFQIEYRFFKKINGILNATEAEFSSDDAIYYWTVTLADGKELDLTSDGTGKDRQVKYSERLDYVQRCIYTKLTESSVQCAAIRRGLVKIIPESMLNQISFEEMESWVCGDKFIDIDLVRRNTKLVGYTADDEVIKNFWEIFESLTQPDRRRFIKFCYAIERLP
jgi:E3 ubiquitin-protein ligase HECTD3